MIANITITITETKEGIRREYRFGEGDVYYIARSWIAFCGLPLPKKFSVFTFGGKRLFVTSDSLRREIKAIPVDGLWQLLFLRYWFKEKYLRVKRRLRLE
jgi:hypothetical protein